MILPFGESVKGVIDRDVVMGGTLFKAFRETPIDRSMTMKENAS